MTDAKHHSVKPFEHLGLVGRWNITAGVNTSDVLRQQLCINLFYHVMCLDVLFWSRGRRLEGMQKQKCKHLRCFHCTWSAIALSVI